MLDIEEGRLKGDDENDKIQVDSMESLNKKLS